jgi:hypothetical protein
MVVDLIEIFNSKVQKHTLPIDGLKGQLRFVANTFNEAITFI